MGPLLEYRRIAAQQPAFATPKVFSAVLAGELAPVATAVAGILQRRGNQR